MYFAVIIYHGYQCCHHHQSGRLYSMSRCC